MAINLVNDNISTIEIQGKKYNIKAIPFHGTAAEWENNNYIPKDGEIIIYDIDENYNYKRIKIGNGTDIVSVLPFLDEDITSRILALETWSQEIEEKIAYIDPEDNENIEDASTQLTTIDIVDNLESTSVDRPLSANQGRILNEKLEKKAVQSDWNQEDEAAGDYIKNKPVEETADDAFALLLEVGVLEATIDEEGFVLTDENNNILTI